MAEVYVLVASGQTVSDPFTLPRPDFPFVVHVPSLAAGNDVRPQFSATSGGPFTTLQKTDGSGAAYSVHSGAGTVISVIRDVPSPFGRFTFSGSPGDVRTLTLFPTRR